MECLICYKEEFSLKFENSLNISSIICRLFDISVSNFIIQQQQNGDDCGDNPPLPSSSSSTSVCFDCLQKIDEVTKFFEQLDAVQVKLADLRKEILEDLLKSQKLSEQDGKQTQERIKLVQEICHPRSSRVNDKDGDGTVHPSDLVQVKLEEKEGQNDDNGDIDDYFGNPDYDELVESPEEEADDAENSDEEYSKKTRKNRHKRILKSKKESASGKSKAKRSKLEKKALKLKRRKSGRKSKTSKNKNYNEGEGRQFNCKFCEEICETAYALKLHMKNDHTDVDVDKSRKSEGGDKLCTVCNKMFDRPGRLVVHMRTHTGERTAICDLCGRGYASEKYLKSHLRAKHGIGTHGVHKCPICGKFSAKKSLQDRHLIRAHGLHVPDLKTWLCEVCSKEFSSEFTLSEHQKAVHLGQKYACDKCPKTFGTNGGLTQHLRAFHEKAFRFYCHICGKGTMTQWQMTCHNKNSHEGVKNFACAELNCDKRFTTAQSLRIHMFSHTNERPLKCSVCSKGFVTNQKLKNHELLHTGIRPHLCPQCGESYAIKSTLQQHIREKHQGMKTLIADITKRRKFVRRNRVQVVGPSGHSGEEQNQDEPTTNNNPDLNMMQS